jgi:hypothetical protein
MKGAQSFGSLEFSRAEIKQFACSAETAVKKKKDVGRSTQNAKRKTNTLAATNREIFLDPRDRKAISPLKSS